MCKLSIYKQIPNCLGVPTFPQATPSLISKANKIMAKSLLNLKETQETPAPMDTKDIPMDNVLQMCVCLFCYFYI